MAETGGEPAPDSSEVPGPLVLSGPEADSKGGPTTGPNGAAAAAKKKKARLLFRLRPSKSTEVPPVTIRDEGPSTAALGYEETALNDPPSTGPESVTLQMPSSESPVPKGGPSRRGAPPTDEDMAEDDDGEEDDDEDANTQEDLPFPGFVPTAFKCLSQENPLRHACLRIITWPYPFYEKNI